MQPSTTSDNSLTTALNYYGNKTRLKFTGICLKQQKFSYTHEKLVNIYIVYELGASGSHKNDPTLNNCLVGAATLTENADIDKYGYLVTKLGLIQDQVFHFQVMDLIKMY